MSVKALIHILFILEIMMSYDFGIIDAQYILRRNWSIQKSHGKVNQFLLMKSFIQSVFKLKRDFGFDRALLCFDSAPYYAMLENPDYKADREYVTQESLEDMESNLIFMTDESEIAELKNRIEEYKVKIDNEKAFQYVKYEMVGNGTKLGFRTLIKKHWEADNIAFACAEKCRELGYSAILITTDHDWCNFRSKYVTYSTPKNENRNDYTKDLIFQSRKLRIPLYELGILREIYGDSHNNAKGFDFSDKVSFDEFALKLYNEDTTLEGYTKARNFYNAMNIKSHMSEIQPLLEFTMLSGIEVKVSDWFEFVSKNKFMLPVGNYNEFIIGNDKDYRKSVPPPISGSNP